jgi:hypothetical protein
MRKPILGVKVDQPTIDRLDRLAVLMAKSAGLESLTRSDVHRAALLAGMDALEARHGAPAKKETKPARKPAK